MLCFIAHTWIVIIGFCFWWTFTFNAIHIEQKRHFKLPKIWKVSTLISAKFSIPFRFVPFSYPRFEVMCHFIQDLSFDCMIFCWAWKPNAQLNSISVFVFYCLCRSVFQFVQCRVSFSALMGWALCAVWCHWIVQQNWCPCTTCSYLRGSHNALTLFHCTDLIQSLFLCFAVSLRWSTAVVATDDTPSGNLHKFYCCNPFPHIYLHW